MQNKSSLPSGKDNEYKLGSRLPSLISSPSSTLQSRLYILLLRRINRPNKCRLFILNLDSMSLESLHEVEHVSFHFVWVCEFVERDYGPCFEGLLAVLEELGSAWSFEIAGFSLLLFLGDSRIRR